MRADARRNRRRLLDAAIGLILQVGGAPTMDAVASRAGVGAGTLYRHFPDQQQLLRAVALSVLDRTIENGRATLAESSGGREALHRYMHGAVDVGLGVLNIIHPLVVDADWPDRRMEAEEVLELLAEHARRDGAISDAVTSRDIALASIRFCRPLGIGLDEATEKALAHHHLDQYLLGLSVGAGHESS